MEYDVTVAPRVVLMAIRYGLGRKTYAHDDALDLIRDYRDSLARAGWLGIVEDELRHLLRRARSQNTDGVKELLEDMKSWTL